MITKDKTSLIASMLIFGTIGVLRRHIDIPSGALAMLRGYIGAAVLIVLTVITGKRPETAVLKRNLLKLLVSGAFIGFNWMLLFEAYNYTSVATATLCYYMAPVIVMLMSPVLLKEKLTARKGICIAAAIIGMIPVSGMLSVEGFGLADLKGVLMGLGAAVLYACVMLMNKRITEVKAMDRTIVQLAAAALVVTPYTFAAEGFRLLDMDMLTIGLVLVAGIIHTGITYCMYFTAVEHIPGQAVAILSYIDPLVAVIIGVLILGEPLTAPQLIGGTMILGFTLWNEL